MAKLQLSEIEKAYEVNNKYNKSQHEAFLLKVENLQINDGDFFGLLGPSGCGKTTLLKIIAGLIEADRGNIYREGQDITNVPSEKRKIGMVFQQPLLFPHMTVGENAAFGLKMQNMSRKDRMRSIKAILEKVDLKGFENRYPSQLSGGQQQRVAIVRALVCKPEILLMDEPFSALDPKLREEMRRFISYLHKEYNMTIVFVTHDKEEAFTLFSRMAVMKEGEILQLGSPRDIYENPSNTDIAQFLGAKNIFYGKVENNIFKNDKFQFEICGDKHNGYKGHLILRPECLEVKKVVNNFKKFDNKENNNYYYLGTVKECLFRQGFLFLKVEINSVIVEIIQKLQFNIEVGEKVIVEYDRNKIIFINEEL